MVHILLFRNLKPSDSPKAVMIRAERQGALVHFLSLLDKRVTGKVSSLLRSISNLESLLSASMLGKE